jgi:hypothetical protein
VSGHRSDQQPTGRQVRAARVGRRAGGLAVAAVLAAAALAAPSALAQGSGSAAGTSTGKATVLQVGNPNGKVPVPPDGQPESTAHPTKVIGTGTPAGCTSAAVVAAVAAGGVYTFNCGPNPVTITLTQTAKVFNKNAKLVLDGGGKVTLSGGGKRRIIYQNTCDQAQGWTTPNCADQPTPLLALQNITLADGAAMSEKQGGGGGAVYAEGGQVKITNATFVRNHCNATGLDIGGAALRLVLMSHTATSFVVGSTFGGSEANANSCADGGGIGGLQARKLMILNSTFSHNKATGRGANPPRPGTPGGGNGGAIYTDGVQLALIVAGTVIEDNKANEGGASVFYTSNDGTGALKFDSLISRRNPDAGWVPSTPGMFIKGLKAYGADTVIDGPKLKKYIRNTVIQP